MKKMLACILSACLLTAALSGCGGNETKTIRIYDGTCLLYTSRCV